MDKYLKQLQQAKTPAKFAALKAQVMADNGGKLPDWWFKAVGK